jgi:hypothetical protein
MSEDPVITTLKAVKRAAKQAADRCDTESGRGAELLAGEIKWSALSMLEDQLDVIINDMELERGLGCSPGRPATGEPS